MSPEAKQRIARVVNEVWYAASKPGAAKDVAAQQRMVTYAQGILETAIEGEIERRLAERGAG